MHVTAIAQPANTDYGLLLGCLVQADQFITLLAGPKVDRGMGHILM